MQIELNTEKKPSIYKYFVREISLMKTIILFLGLILILSGCTQQPANGLQDQNLNDSMMTDDTMMNDNANAGVDSMKTVKSGSTIKVEYVGTYSDTGEVFDQSEGRGPLEFVAGSGQMIQGFDEAVMGMKLNEEKTVIIPPEKAYGEAGNGQTVEAPIEQIQGDENVTVGMQLFTNTGQQGTVTAINNGVATITFVHPLAGKTLQFWIKVVEIQ
ncbi:MAG TPA: peptidylprolyl isomerase [archaeon]|nr:peptidylprolyl isomerase [archaeon]